MFLKLLFSLLYSSLLLAATNELKIGVSTTQFDYRETSGNGTLLDSETNQFSDITGMSISFVPIYDGIYYDAQFSKGKTNYIGDVIGGNHYGNVRSLTENTLSNYEFGYKMNRFISYKLSMPLSIGFGYRSWLRSLQSTSTIQGYDEKYDWKYFTIGTGYHYNFNTNSSLGLEFNYKKAFDSKMSENWHNSTFELNNVEGYSIKIPFDTMLSRNLLFYTDYIFEYWNIGASNIVNGYYEPNSITKMNTINFGLKYRY